MSDEQGGFIKEYDLDGIPEYRKPIIEELIFIADFFIDGYDTPKNLDDLAVKILEVFLTEEIK